MNYLLTNKTSKIITRLLRDLDGKGKAAYRKPRTYSDDENFDRCTIQTSVSEVRLPETNWQVREQRRIANL